MKLFFSRISNQIESSLIDAQQYISKNSTLVFVLAIILLAGYGFELFNLNLTIDEEVHALSIRFDDWISQGRWGMYLLHRFLLPQPVIPFVPLFIALVFHLAAILTFKKCLGIVSRSEGLIMGAIGVSYSGMAFVYTFSTLNYGIGIALFLVTISLLIYSRTLGWRQSFAAIPASIAISVYQPILLAFACIFLVFFISTEIRAERRKIDLQGLIRMVGVGLLALLLYSVVQRIFISVAGSGTDYISQIVDVQYLLESPRIVLDGVRSAVTSVYTGSDLVYGMKIRLLGVLLGVGALGAVASILRSRLSGLGKVILGFLALALLLIPFGSVLTTRGLLINRSLIALPMALSGWLALSLLSTPRLYKLIIGILAGVCTFQFIVSSNLLFSSSRLSLEADRLLAAEIVSRIDTAKSVAGADEGKYLEVIGYFERPETSITPKIETFGASFFEWDQGNVYRIVYFLNLLGFSDIQAMPLDTRGEFVQIGNTMPVWPEMGSIKVIEEAILLKFGPYSFAQVELICSAGNIPDFCEPAGALTE
jgi:hypothetical protein